MSQSDSLRRAIAAATTGAEQNALAAALAAADRHAAARRQEDLDLDWAGTAQAATLSPVAVHTMHTAATDWLGEIPEGAPDYQRRLHAEASLWFVKLPPMVAADVEEFNAQAHGAARRTAGRLGVHPEAVVPSFMDYVTFLRKQAGSGLPEVQQTIDANNAPAATPLPPDVFDNFAPEVHPINAGTSGTEDSNRNPMFQQLMGGGRPAGTSPTEQQMPELGDQRDPGDQESPEAEEDSGALSAATAYLRATAVNHTFTLDDFRRQGAYGEDGHALFDPEPHHDFGDAADDARDMWHEDQRRNTDLGPIDQRAHERQRDRDREYQMLRHYDDAQEYGEDYARRAHPMPYPHTAASGLDQIQQTTAPDGVTSHPTPLPTETAFPWVISEDESGGTAPVEGEMASGGVPAEQQHAARRVVADQWHGQEWPHAVVQPNAANNPMTTPATATGAYAEGHAAGTADRSAPDTAPTFADGSSHAPEFVQGYSAGYGGASTATPTNPPPSLTGPPSRLSHLLSTAAERALPDYTAGYNAGTGWKAGDRTIPGLGNDAFEAGLYAGLLDNPGAQHAFTEGHRRAATTHPAAGARIARHAKASAYMVDNHQLPDGVQIHGPYLRTHAGTSTDLDTMAPGTSADPGGNTPFNGPGTPPMLQGQYGAAEPAGPPPYNGAAPFGTPAVPTGSAPAAAPVTVPQTGMTTDNRATAFRRRVQANLARTAVGAPLLTTPTTHGSL